MKKYPVLRYNTVLFHSFADYRLHRGEVVGLAFSPDGEFMYSADSQGSLALYNASEESHNVIRVMCTYRQCTAHLTSQVNFATSIVIRVISWMYKITPGAPNSQRQHDHFWIHFVPDWLGNVVARGTERAPDTLTLSSDSRCLAFIGPSEYIVTIADAQSLDEVLRQSCAGTAWAAQPHINDTLNITTKSSNNCVCLVAPHRCEYFGRREPSPRFCAEGLLLSSLHWTLVGCYIC